MTADSSGAVLRGTGPSASGRQERVLAVWPIEEGRVHYELRSPAGMLAQSTCNIDSALDRLSWLAELYAHVRETGTYVSGRFATQTAVVVHLGSWIAVVSCFSPRQLLGHHPRRTVRTDFLVQPDSTMEEDGTTYQRFVFISDLDVTEEYGRELLLACDRDTTTGDASA